MVLLHIYY